MKKIISIFLILTMSLSCVAFAENNSKSTNNDFEWTANAQQLTMINQLSKKSLNDAEMLKIVDPQAYNELKKKDPQFLESLQSPEISTRALPPDFGNADYDCSYQIQATSHYDQIVARGYTRTSVGTQDLGLVLSIVDDSWVTVAKKIANKSSTDYISTRLIDSPDDGNYYVHCRHGFAYYDLNGDKKWTWPTSHTDHFDFTKY